MSLYEWQEKALTSPNDHAIWCAEAGTGKSHAAGLWLEQGERSKNAVVMCPKQIRADWKKRAPYATVYSFEDFLKADAPSKPTAVVVDEADAMASPLFVAKSRSKRTGKLYNYLYDNPDVHILLLTATPVRSTPWNMHTLLVLAKIKSPATWKTYRELYFELQMKPYLPRPAYFPKLGWQKEMQTLINKYTHTALMADMVDLPEETHEVITLKKPDYEQNEEWEPMAQFVADHRLEQRTKGAEIKKLSRGYRKVVVVAHYREQIDQLYKELSNERETFVLDGRTGNPTSVIADAEGSGECYFIIQASVGAGFELPSFAVMIFASQGYSVRNWVQMKARIRRINSLKPTKYFYLQAGRCDKMIYDSIQKGKDFVPSEYQG
jgi:putative lipoic acid-binding regulatory protein